MMNKLALNYKIATLYGVDPFLQCMVGFDINEGNIYKYIPFIDDWNRLMPLALSNKIGFVAMNTIALAGIDEIEAKENYSDHESPEAAARYAIAMALVKLKESK